MNSIWLMIRTIWRGEFPSNKPRRHTLIEKLLCTTTVALTALSLAHYFKRLFKKGSIASHEFMDAYVLCWTAVFSWLLFSQHVAPRVAVVITIYGLAELINYRLFFLFVKSQQEPWRAEILRRSVAIVLLNFYEAVTGFAILYLHSSGVGQNCGPATVLTPGTAFYFSLTTMTTVGFGDFVAVTTLARAIAIAQIATTVLFVIFLVPALVSVLSPALTKGDEIKS